MGEMVETLINGRWPLLLPPHRAAFHAERPHWHEAWLASIHDSLKPDDVIVDVGSEQGDLSALVASWVPDGGIVLVEPQPLFWPTIRETFEANGLRPIKGYEAFATSETSKRIGWDSITQWPASSAPRFGDIDPGFYHLNEHDQVYRVTLDDLVADLIPELNRPLPIDALVIDVEGAEFHTLKGAEGMLLYTHPLVWCAIHPEIMYDRYRHDPNELLAYMYRLGYRWDFLGFQGELHFKFSPR